MEARMNALRAIGIGPTDAYSPESARTEWSQPASRRGASIAFAAARSRALVVNGEHLLRLARARVLVVDGDEAPGQRGRGPGLARVEALRARQREREGAQALGVPPGIPREAPDLGKHGAWLSSRSLFQCSSVARTH